MPLIAGIAFLGTNCGGGDDDSGGSMGGAAGTNSAGSAGKSGSNGKGGASGKGGVSGASGEGGGDAAAGSAGENSSAGGSDAAGSSGRAGGAGEGGGQSDAIALRVADSVSELIEADEGGSVTLGELTLVIPPAALTEDTEITIRSFEGTNAVFVLEPDGLEFETPITARFTYPATGLEGFDEPGAAPMFALETAALGEPLELSGPASVRLDDDGNIVAESTLEHFSAVVARFAFWRTTEEHKFLSREDLSVSPAVVPLAVEFAAVGKLTAKAFSPFDLTIQSVGGDRGLPPVRVDPLEVRAVATEAVVTGAVYKDPSNRLVALDPPVRLDSGEPELFTRLFHCAQAGEGDVLFGVSVVVTADVEGSGFVLQRVDTHEFRLVPGVSGSKRFDLTTGMRVSALDVTCLEQPSTLTSLGVPARLDELLGAFKAAWQQDCFWLSDHSACESPTPARAIVAVLDPVLQVGPVSAARLEAAFPCGDGPVGRTLCGTPGAFAEGDYVLVVASFGDDIPLDDATSLFQHAFVFDADGDTGNNYVAPPAYPDDFFAGTDKWYQLFYTPQQGFSLRVVDARISVNDPVATNARMVIAGRELSAFIPRAELDGSTPGFRATTFRHEGDYGLQGGPWDASYYPPLGEPLLPAAAGDPIPLPEE